jgi:hypothetical protein
MFDQPFYDGGALGGCWCLAGGEQACAAAVDDGLQGFEGVLAGFVEGAVEGDLHGCGQLRDAARKWHVYTAVGGEEADDDGVGAEGFALHDGALYLSHFGLAIAEVARARADEHVGAQAEGADAVFDVFCGGGEASDLKVAAELNALCATGFGGLGRLPRRGAYLNGNHGAKIRKKGYCLQVIGHCVVFVI